MRYKRVNTLAVDFGVLPSRPGISAIQKFVETGLHLDATTFKSVQIHTTRSIVYIGLPDGQSAEAIAKEHHLLHQIPQNAKFYNIPVFFVDDDVVDVRVSDLPPETPHIAITDKLRQYGEVLAITDEVWKNYFPGAASGVRVVRMKVSRNIPSFVSIASTTAHIKYPGQVQFCRCGRKKHKNKCSEVAATKEATTSKEKQPMQNNTLPEPTPEASGVTEMEESTAEQPAIECNNADPADDGFRLVTKRRSKMKRQLSQESKAESTEKRFFADQGDPNAKISSSDSEFDDDALKNMSSQMAMKLHVKNYIRWSKLKYDVMRE